MAVIPPPDTPVIDRGTGQMTQVWYKFLSDLTLQNQPILTTSYIDLTEMTAPVAGTTNHARLFAQDNGLGKTQLAALFPTGAIQPIATEP